MIYDTEIYDNILTCVDPETGEVFDEETYDAIQSDIEHVAEQLALEVKNAKAEVKAIKDEVKNLQNKALSAENREERCKGLLRYLLHGEKFKTPRANVFYRKSKSVDVRADFDELAAVNPGFIRVRKEYNKTAIKEALENGQVVPGCEMVEKESVIVR